MSKKSQITLFLIIFSFIVLFFSITSISPNVWNLYQTLFTETYYTDNYGLNLFLQPFTGFVSFFVVLLSILASALFTMIFTLLFPYLTIRKITLQDEYLIPYMRNRVIIFGIIVTIVTIIIGSLIANPLYALLVISGYVFPMYLFYFGSNRLMFFYVFRKLKLVEEEVLKHKTRRQNEFKIPVEESQNAKFTNK